VIEVDGLHKLYGDFPAVQGLTFRVGPGEVLGLVGPNGAGKTTTIRSIAGIIIPTSGRIHIAGHDLAVDPVAAKAALAFIPDEPHLFEYLTVEEHLRFVARLYRLGDVSPRIPALLEELDLSDKLRALPGELSRGMKQKLAIARVYLAYLLGLLAPVAPTILYFASEVPDRYQILLVLNPLAPLLTAWSDVIDRGLAPDPMDLAIGAKQVFELQRLLVEQGYDVGKIDGILGLATRTAVKDVQIKLGLPADSYPNPELLDRLRSM
jgi:ABC-type transport system involved in cytochrome c biogenesis ATPase subunit